MPNPRIIGAAPVYTMIVPGLHEKETHSGPCTVIGLVRTWRGGTVVMEMRRWKAPLSRGELYYFDTAGEYEAVRLAARLYLMIQEALRTERKSQVVVLCIGTDRSTGDSLGPLTGYHLWKHQLRHIQVLGTLHRPVHAMNLRETLRVLEMRYPECLVVAVDASVGSGSRVGSVTLGRGAIRPGLGVSKQLQPVGDIFITGVVSGGCGGDPMMLQSIRLGTVMQMAECISESICLVEKLWERNALI